MSFAGKNLTQGGQMTAYRWRMFIQVNNWIGFWIFILFAVLTTAIFLWRIPQHQQQFYRSDAGNRDAKNIRRPLLVCTNGDDDGAQNDPAANLC